MSAAVLDCYGANDVVVKAYNIVLGDSVASKVQDGIKSEEVAVDDIHNAVENILMEKDKKVAKAYILYRQRRTDYREKGSELNKEIERLYSTINKDNANAANGSAASKMYSVAEAATKRYNLSRMNPVHARNHKLGRVYIHDLGYYGITFNCFFNPLSDMLKNGFNNGVGTIRTPKRIASATALACIILQSSQNSMFGGQGFLNFDTDLAPYVVKEYEWQRKSYIDALGSDNLTQTDKDKILARTDRAVYQAMEQFVYNCNMMRSRSGAQVTFSSVNFGTDTSDWARMISKNLFKAYIAGLGRGENPIFPNLCYRVKEGINLNEGDPNYDVTLLAVECVGKRIQPRFVFCDSPAYDGMPIEYIGTMGCVDGQEVVSYQYHGKFYCEGIERLWNRLEEDKQKQGESTYIVPDTLKIYDGENGFVKVYTVVKNPDKGNWVQIDFDNGRSILVTSDHPLYTDEGRIRASQLCVGDKVKSYFTFPKIEESEWVSPAAAYALGVLIADGNYDKNVSATFDTRTEQDIISHFRTCVETGLNHSTAVTSYQRQEKGDYTCVRVLEKQKELCEYLESLFGGKNKINRSIPSEVFSSHRNIKMSFMAGMIDADGHISKKSKVQIGSVNKELSLQQLALAQSLGLPAKMYRNKYNGQDKNKIRYRVEFSMTEEISGYMASSKKTDVQWNGTESHTKTPDEVVVKSITFLGSLGMPSYDVETATDKFTLSFVRSGNCRTAVRDNVNGSKNPDARGNLAFTTINLPMLALEAKEQGTGDILSAFWSIFDEVLNDNVDELKERYDVISNLKKRDIPFVSDWYMGHEKLEDEESAIEPMVKNGSLSIGFVGLAECLKVLIGKHQGESEEAQRLGLSIVKAIRAKADEAKKKYGLNYSCFASPAESACYTLLKKTRKRFGVVNGITDKEYFTNSFHLPVSFECDAKKKIDTEAPYHLLCNAGAIFYIEVGNTPKWNPEGVLSLIRYMDKSGIVYGGLNWTQAFCQDCGHQGSWEGACPVCGSENIKETAIITGYLSETWRFNKGKEAEKKDRVSHTGGKL